MTSASPAPSTPESLDARTEGALLALGEAARRTRERAEMAEQLEELMLEREAAADARDRRSRIRTTTALVVVFLIAIGAAGLSALNTRAQNQRTEDVAAALAKPVADQVLADGRKESAEAARGVLRAANTRLIATRPPVVPEPPLDALSVIVQMQGNRAQLLADFGSVDFIGEGLRARFGATGAFPAAFLDTLPAGPPPTSPTVPAEPGDQVVELLPSDLPAPGGPTLVPLPDVERPAAPAGPDGNPAPAPQRPGTRPAPAPRAPAADPAPAPAPAPNRDRGLCLGGFLLCER